MYQVTIRNRNVQKLTDIGKVIVLIETDGEEKSMRTKLNTIMTYVAVSYYISHYKLEKEFRHQKVQFYITGN